MPGRRYQDLRIIVSPSPLLSLSLFSRNIIIKRPEWRVENSFAVSLQRNGLHSISVTSDYNWSRCSCLGIVQSLTRSPRIRFSFRTMMRRVIPTERFLYDTCLRIAKFYVLRAQHGPFRQRFRYPPARSPTDSDDSGRCKKRYLRRSDWNYHFIKSLSMVSVSFVISWQICFINL